MSINRIALLNIVNLYVIIITIYRPTNVQSILFNEKLNDLLRMIQQENKTIQQVISINKILVMQ